MKLSFEGLSNSIYISWGNVTFGDDCHPLLVGFGFIKDKIELCSDSAIYLN